jgi:hypothetical protein
VARADDVAWDAARIRAHAETYSAARFEASFRAIVERVARAAGR